MARARNIKPGLFKNEDLAECSIWARFIFPGLWMLADREGRLEDRPKRIKGELLPFDSQDVEPLLRELAGRGFILRYEVEGVSYIQISKFSAHQTPHYTEKESVIPPPNSGSDDAIKKDDSKKDSLIKRGSLPPDSLIPDSLIPDSPKKTLSGKPDCPPGFSRFWAAWPSSPRKVGKADCVSRWKRRGYEEQADAIVAHVERMKRTKQWQDGFEPAPATYLNQRRFEDEPAADAPAELDYE